MSEVLKPVYYLCGAEDYLVEDAARDIRKNALEGGLESMNLQIFDSKTMDAADVVAAASTLPAFSQRRVVVVRGADAMKAAQEKEFSDYIKNPSPTTSLIFVAEGQKTGKEKSDFIKALSDKGYLKSFARLDEKGLVAWIRKEAEKDGKKISVEAARKLVAITGNKLRDLKGELEKLVIFSGTNAEMTVADVEDVVLDCREETIFSLSDAIGEKKLKKAIEVYERVSMEEPLKILGAIARHIRVLLKVKALSRKRVPAGTMAGMAGVPPFHLDKYLSSSRLFTEGELKSAIEKLARADGELKTGRLPEHLVLPRLIMELCGAF